MSLPENYEEKELLLQERTGLLAQLDVLTLNLRVLEW
jgi:hypothetical protein